MLRSERRVDKDQIFSDVPSCSLETITDRWTLRITAPCSFETSVNSEQLTQRNIPEDLNIQAYRTCIFHLRLIILQLQHARSASRWPQKKAQLRRSTFSGPTEEHRSSLLIVVYPSPQVNIETTLEID